MGEINKIEHLIGGSGVRTFHAESRVDRGFSAPDRSEGMSNATDPHGQLRALYRSLLERQEHFDEFKQLLALYPVAMAEGHEEPKEARELRDRLNERIQTWIGDFEGLSVMQVLQWRAIVVEERFNVVLSPWKESNVY
jgi:hypothetical protein